MLGTRWSQAIADRQVRLAAGSGSGRASPPAPRDGRGVASGPAATGQAATGRAARVADLAAATGRADPPGPLARVRGSRTPAVARGAPGWSATPTPAPVPETAAARMLVRRGPDRTVHPDRSRRDPIPVTLRLPDPRPITPPRSPGSSRMRLPRLGRPLSLACPDHGTAVPRTVVAPGAPRVPAAPGRDRVVPTSDTGRTPRGAQTRSRILQSRLPAARSSSPVVARSRRRSSPAARRGACSSSHSGAWPSRSSCSTR